MAWVLGTVVAGNEGGVGGGRAVVGCNLGLAGLYAFCEASLELRDRNVVLGLWSDLEEGLVAFCDEVG